MIVGAEEARQHKRAGASTHVARTCVQPFRRADLVCVEPLRNVLNAHNERDAGNCDQNALNKKQFVIRRES